MASLTAATLSLAALSLLACQSVTTTTNPCPDAPEGSKESCTQRTVRGVANASSAWANPSSVWNETRLTYSFLDGGGNQHRLFNKVLDIWREVLDKRLVFVELKGVNASTAHIRVSFRCSGHWSYVGRDALSAPAGKATMNIQLRNESFDEWRWVVLHELGHALGLRHEHAHPQSGIAWDKEAVYAFYAKTQGWDRRTVNHQVFTPAPDQWTGTRWDPDSIMHYPVPANLTLNKVAVAWNESISPQDVAFVQQLYPLP